MGGIGKIKADCLRLLDCLPFHCFMKLQSRESAPMGKYALYKIPGIVYNINHAHTV